MAIFDGNLKQRLIGALVLIVLAIVFLPMIFNNKGEDQADTVVTVPEPPTQPAASINQVPVNTPTEPVTAPPTVANTQPTANTDNSTQATTQNTTTQTTTTNQPITATTIPKTNEITPSWTIQVASGSIKANADNLTNKLRKANYNAYTRLDGKIYRIFVGPFVQKTEAVRVQNLIEKQFKEKGIIREFKPEAN